MKNPRLPLQALVFPGLLLISTAAQPQTSALCPRALDIPARPLIDVELDAGDTYAHADQADLIEAGLSHLQGNVEMRRDEQHMRADEVFYNRTKNNARLMGDVNLWDESLYLHSDTADIELENSTGVFANADYYLLENRGRGHAEELFIDVDEITRGKVADFTTCDPATERWRLDDNVWKISARELVLNHETDRGTARHVMLKIKDVPVFYSPYLTFPLSQKRKTGFLVPTYGTSSNGGLELQTPLYLNIAPNMDATLTPRLITDRGLMGMGEFRYLTRRMRGFVNLDYLPGDNLFQGRDRSLLRLAHDQSVLGRGKLQLRYNRASDRRYFQDLGAQQTVTSQRYLPQLAAFSYGAARWQLHARLQGYQSVDETISVTSKPYQRLPQVQFNYQPLTGANRLNLTLRSELVHFDRTDETGLANDVNGLRMDVFPMLSYRHQHQAGHFTPTVGLRYTRYELSDSGPFASSPSRLLPMVSLDTGLIFDRYTDLSDAKYLQTLEPRLYYLYVPDHDQSDLPVFDTGIYNTSYDSLFRADRFSSADRMGDANQITAAITSRLINRNTGSETAYVRLAQTYRFAAQDVITQRIAGNGRLVNTGVRNDTIYSPLVAELGTTLIKHWTMTAELHWQPEGKVTEKLAIKAQYRPADDKVLNLGYRVRRAASGVIRRNPTDIDQTDISLAWPVGRQWHVVGRWNYAVSENRSLDMFAGVQYDSCCFAVRAIGRRFLTSLDGDFTRGFFLQFELKGLAGLGQAATHFISQSIPGYNDGF